MQKLWGLVIVATASGCAPYSGYYREGQTVSRLNADMTTCEVGGARDVPPNTQIRTTPIEVLPGRTVCQPDGTCTTFPGHVSGGDVVTYDANADLRGRVVGQCMADKGYRKVQIPLCSPEVSRIAAARAPGVLPPLGPTTCAARAAGSGYIFVNTAAPGR